MNEELLLNEVTKNCNFRLQEGVRMIQIALEALKEEALWKKPSPALNSVGNLFLHLCGNVTQYVISGVGNLPDERNRNAEFTQEGGYTKSELQTLLNSTIREAQEVIESCTVEQLLEVRKIQGLELSGLGAIIHAVEHFSYHTGQIAFWVKYLNNQDLGFYNGLDLNKINE